MALDSAATVMGDIPLTLEMELDRRVLTIGEILALEKDGILTLDRSAGENVSLWIGNTLVASGEIVILEDTMGVRITDFHERTDA
jgi:flagellar motor switch protein FliN/FliY